MRNEGGDDEIHGTGASKDNDPLIVNEGPMTKSQVKKVKEDIGLLVQITVDETSITTSKRTNFILSLEDGTK